ncbi:MAG: hypothetical protein EPN36_03685 [Rhodanobacteraceae bacterium]|nr:MAG: hypothetical protein EPN36_03685 [Rhodanobacteraceae bacterium]
MSEQRTSQAAPVGPAEPNLTQLVERAEVALRALCDGFRSLHADPGQVLGLALSSLQELAAKPYEFYWCGHLLECALPDLAKLPSSLPALLAAAYHVKEQDAREFLSYFGDEPAFRNGPGRPKFGIPLPCSHAGCGMSTSISFSTPPEMIEAKARSVHEIWFCRRHIETSWSHERALPDYVLSILSRVQQQPGISLTAAGADSRLVDILERLGLIRQVRVTQGGAIRRCELRITAEGDGAVSRAGTAGSSLLQREAVE